jgi:hypothetical protein
LTSKPWSIALSTIVGLSYQSRSGLDSTSASPDSQATKLNQTTHHNASGTTRFARSRTRAWVSPLRCCLGSLSRLLTILNFHGVEGYGQTHFSCCIGKQKIGTKAKLAKHLCVPGINVSLALPRGIATLLMISN